MPSCKAHRFKGGFMIFLKSKFYLPCFRTLASGDKVFFKFSATVSAILPQWSSKKTQQISVFEIQRKRFRIEKFKGRSFHNQHSVFKSSRNAPLDLRMSHFHPHMFRTQSTIRTKFAFGPVYFLFLLIFPKYVRKTLQLVLVLFLSIKSVILINQFRYI